MPIALVFFPNSARTKICDALSHNHRSDRVLHRHGGVRRVRGHAGVGRRPRRLRRRGRPGVLVPRRSGPAGVVGARRQRVRRHPHTVGSIDGNHPSHNARHRQMIDVKETRHGPFHEQGIATDRSAAGLSSREERSAVWMTWPVRSWGRRACMMPCWTIDCGGGLHLCRTICVFLDVESH